VQQDVELFDVAKCCGFVVRFRLFVISLYNLLWIYTVSGKKESTLFPE